MIFCGIPILKFWESFVRVLHCTQKHSDLHGFAVHLCKFCFSQFRLTLIILFPFIWNDFLRSGHYLTAVPATFGFTTCALTKNAYIILHVTKKGDFLVQTKLYVLSDILVNDKNVFIFNPFFLIIRFASDLYLRS